MSIRISPPKVFPIATGAGRPAADAGGSLDSHRQTSFVLDGDLAAVLDGLNLEGGVAAASTGAKSRTQAMVAALGLWSRSWLCRLEALHAVQCSPSMPFVPVKSSPHTRFSGRCTGWRLTSRFRTLVRRCSSRGTNRGRTTWR